MDAMLNLVNVLVQEKVAGCARCNSTIGSDQEPSIVGLLNVVNAFSREMKEQEKLLVSLRQIVKVSLLVATIV